jgi:molybdenum cofactor cytidylyltransferase
LIFGPTPLDQALGAVLAHTQRLPGRVIRKGAVLDESAIAALRAAGVGEVIAATLEADDVDEDSAARRLGEALLAQGITASRAATGRVNLHAGHSGLLRIQAATIDALNDVHPALTVGTLPDYAVVEAREMIATIKIIPFAAPSQALARAEALAHRAQAFTLHRFSPRTVGLVLTTLPGLKQSVLDGTVDATLARVQALGGTLLTPRTCPHEEEPIARELAALMAQGADLLLVAGASAVVDSRDVGPAGIVRAGGEILHFGMPVDPGNLICLGRIGERPALVLPGCARSPKLNGIDFVLSRLFAGLGVTGSDVAHMGVGGLLKDVDSRPLPRARAARREKQVAAIVMAAGRSRRMAPRNKLLMPIGGGKLMIQRVVDNVLASQARPVFVVTGHQETELRNALQGRNVTFVHSPHYADGMAESVKAGIGALPATIEAAVVCLGDMPLVGPGLIDQLIAAWDREEGRTIVMPTFNGLQGNPVLWDRRYFEEIGQLGGDMGARQILNRHADAIAEVAAENDGTLKDFDTIDTLEELGGVAPQPPQSWEARLGRDGPEAPDPTP